MGNAQRCAIAAICLLAGISGAAADPVLVNLQQLQSAGYRIKSQSVLGDDEALVIDDWDQFEPQILVTFQKGASIAVCQFGLSDWNNQDATMTISSRLCSIDVPPAAKR